MSTKLRNHDFRITYNTVMLSDTLKFRWEKQIAGT